VLFLRVHSNESRIYVRISARGGKNVSSDDKECDNCSKTNSVAFSPQVNYTDE
jgi:hypothetical protein